MTRIALALVISALPLVSGEAAAAVIWTCEVLHAYDIGPDGALKRSAPSPSLVGRFTASDETGEVAGRLLGQPQEWKAVPRRFGPDQDGLQSLRTSGGRQHMNLYIETFAAGPVKPFVLSDLDVGASRTGTCRAER